MAAQDQVRDWLGKLQTGCAFASMIARAPTGLAMATFSGLASAADIGGVFDFAATKHQPAIVVLPDVRTEAELAEQLVALAAGERWRVSRVATPSTLVTTDVFVSLEWETLTAHEWCSPMGLAPLGTMPATRRAPFTCIAAWTDGHANMFRKRVEPIVHFLDVDLSAYHLTAEKYEQRRKESVKRTKEILFDDAASNYRNVAFRLSAAVGVRLASLPPA